MPAFLAPRCDHFPHARNVHKVRALTPVDSIDETYDPYDLLLQSMQCEGGEIPERCDSGPKVKDFFVNLKKIEGAHWRYKDGTSAPALDRLRNGDCRLPVPLVGQDGGDCADAFLEASSHKNIQGVSDDKWRKLGKDVADACNVAFGFKAKTSDCTISFE